jgi:hypothetical protein
VCSVEFVGSPAQVPLRGASSICKEQAMIDAALIALGLGFFALSIGYAIFCDRI